jgi:MFS family permease
MNTNVRALYYFNFFNGFRPHWPIAVIYFQEITTSFAAAMTIYSIVFLSQALLEVPTGMFSDGFQRRKTMILGAISASMSVTCYAIGISFWILALGALLEGLSRAFFSCTESALLFESLPEQDKSSKFQHYLGRINSMSQLALCISAALCALLSLYSFKLVLWVSVIPQVLSLISVLLIKDVRVQKECTQSFLKLTQSALQQFRLNSKLKLVAIVDTLEFGFGEAIFYFQAAFFQTLVPAWVLGLTRCLNHLAGFVGFWFAGPAIKFFGARRTLINGTILASSIETISVLIASAYSPFIMAATNCIFGPCKAARSTLLHLEFSDQQRATMDSMVSFTGSVLFACVSTLLGIAADIWSPRVAILLGLLSTFLIVFIYKSIFHIPPAPKQNATSHGLI